MDDRSVKGKADCSEREKIERFEIISSEANTVRENDSILIKSLFRNFYGRRLNVGIGFQRAYGAILSGDYFDLIKLPDGNYLFVFADISGHGLPAYTTLIRLRSAISISVKRAGADQVKGGVDPDRMIRDICGDFTDIMDDSSTSDFASVIFTFIYNDGDKYVLRFYNRSMLFPVIMRKYEDQLQGIYNLNNQEQGWIPRKGTLLGSDIRALVGDQYYETPPCEFIIYEGDMILFFSDGCIEASSKNGNKGIFGEERVISIVSENHGLPPQLIITELFQSIYAYIGKPEYQEDDMTAVLIDFPLVRE